MGVKKFMDIKEKLQQFFDKEIFSISEENGLYYVVLVGKEFIKPVYETDINGTNIVETGIPLPRLEEMKLIYSKFLMN